VGKEETDAIRKMLDESGVEYKMFEHEPVYTSEQASKVRGVDLKSGVKALVFKTNDGKFVLGLIAAHKKISERKLAEAVGAEALRLAKPNEVLEMTGCEIGSVHPFGNLHNLPTYMDKSVMESDSVNFNVGQHTVSVQMSSEDLAKVVGPQICDISRG
jgi:Ala-tRNA(Pro) deacylase